MTVIVEIQAPPRATTLRVNSGTRLLDACDTDSEALIAFSCRGGSCGTCRVRVLSGANILSPRSAEEEETLGFFGDGDNVRLACQVVLRHAGNLRLQVVDDA